MRWASHAVRMEKERNAYGVLMGKLEGNKPLDRRIIRINLREIRWVRMDWIYLVTIESSGGFL
jgi:hypothetical protein